MLSAIDSFGNSAVEKQIAVSVTPATPVLDGAGNTVTWTQGAAATVVDPALRISNSTLSGATVSVSSGFLPGDQLSFSNQNGIIGSYNASTGVLTLTGTASVATYQAALEQVAFSSTSNDPAQGGNDAVRTVAFAVLAGASPSNVVSSTIDIGRRAAPTLTVAQSRIGSSETLSGTVTDAGSGVAAVEVFINTAGVSTDLGQATITGSTWNYTFNNLTLGIYHFFAVGFDKIGDTTPAIPTGPAVTVISSQPSIGTVVVADNGLSFQGTAAPNRLVSLTDTPAGGQTKMIGTATTGNDGSWTISNPTLSTSVVNTLTATADGLSSMSFILASTASDTLSGTAGQPDVFAFARVYGNDIITGFETSAATGNAHDVIDLSGTAYSSYAQLKPLMSGSTAAVIRFDSNTSITFSGVNANSLQASDFRFS